MNVYFPATIVTVTSTGTLLVSFAAVLQSPDSTETVFFATTASLGASLRGSSLEM